MCGSVLGIRINPSDLRAIASGRLHAPIDVEPNGVRVVVLPSDPPPNDGAHLPSSRIRQSRYSPRWAAAQRIPHAVAVGQPLRVRGNSAFPLAEQ